MNNTITIKVKNARKAYEQADNKLIKQVLETLLGAENVKPQDITERIKTFEDACAELGMDSLLSLPYPSPEGNKERIAINAFAQLRIITKALNEGWEPDEEDESQVKYYPYFKKDGSGFRFFCYYYSYLGPSVGSYLCFKTSELAEYAGKQFTDLYNQMLSL